MNALRPVFLQRLPLFMRSVRFRLTLWSLVILAVVLAAFSVFVYARQARDVDAATADQLSLIAEQVQTYLTINHQQFVQAGTARLGEDFFVNAKMSASLKDVVVELIGLQGEALQPSGPFQPVEANQLEKLWISWDNIKTGERQRTITLLGTASPQDYVFLLTAMPFPEIGVTGLIVGVPVDLAGQLPRLAWTLLTGSLLLLLADLVVGYWLAGRIMRPVQAITRTAREISETDLHRRLNLGTQDELGELADTFDQMLARLQAAFDHQRQFTADASHELRTPLTIVDLETDRALARRRSPEEYEHALEIIRAENEAMSRLVNDLLTLARMEAGQALLRPEALDLSDVALEVVERLAPVAQSKRVALSTGELPQLTSVGDRQYLAQMLTNLVENAIKYAVGENKWVRVETGRPIDGSQVVAWIRVTDNGRGISAEHLPHIFERFYRVDQARARPSEAEHTTQSGSGLGLSIVQWIAQAHGGQVCAYSDGMPGEGSVFEVRLPVKAELGTA